MPRNTEVRVNPLKLACLCNITNAVRIAEWAVDATAAENAL